MVRETRFQYDHLVASGTVDRQAWAQEVREILETEAKPDVPGGKRRTHGAKTRFAAKVGIAVRTLDSWLRAEVDVKEVSVRAVAEAYGLNAMELLIRVGVYSIEDMPMPMPTPLTNAQIDEEQRYVLELELDDEQKAAILAELDAMRTDDERLLEQQRERDRQRRQQRINEMIERARERRTV